MKIVSICPASFASNTYLLVSDGKAFAIDPSVSVTAIERAIKNENTELCGILLTHGHFDHTISIDTLRKKFPVPLMMHADDAPMLTNGTINGFYDFYGKECTHKPADKLFKDGEKLLLGNEYLEIISTPGHSPGSVCFICPLDKDSKFIVTGDTLFSNTIGRCDLWGGDEASIRSSLALLNTLDKDMLLYAGHGPSSTLGASLALARYYIDF